VPRIQIVSKTEIDVELDTLALAFANMSDDDQCRFFVKVAEIAKQWPAEGVDQWYYIGSHLRNCKCSTTEARLMIDEIYEAMHSSTHGVDGL
jgi:hypothetical protein